MAGHSSEDQEHHLAGLENSFTAGPFRQFRVTLGDGQQIHVTFLTSRVEGFEMTPITPNNAQVNETISKLSAARWLE